MKKKKFLNEWDRALEEQAAILKEKASGNILNEMRDYIIKDLINS